MVTIHFITLPFNSNIGILFLDDSGSLSVQYKMEYIHMVNIALLFFAICKVRNCMPQLETMDSFNEIHP